jgi:S-adenosylmethionine:tRNA ribosyltransferase-isomerase
MVFLAMEISDFDYHLPPSAIAQEPLPERDASRLLVLDRATGDRAHRTFRDLPDLLMPGDLLVMNRSRVLPARLLGQRPGGGAAEILLVRPRGRAEWDALVRPGRSLKAGTRIKVSEHLEATIGPPLPPSDPLSAPLRRVILHAEEGNLETALEAAGKIPLPPYIRRPASASDRERYQTIYAREPGSVAAPTAGLHFTLGLLDRLDRRGIDHTEVVLHVGPGTFQPVKTRLVEDHVVAPELFCLPEPAAVAIARARARGGRVIAVGTTSARVLETCALPDRTVRAGDGSTSLGILPGFAFQVIDGLITNFHLPRSSLLLLVAALAGRDHVIAAYAEALNAGYRFYSYGDAMFVTPGLPPL